MSKIKTVVSARNIPATAEGMLGLGLRAEVTLNDGTNLFSRNSGKTLPKPGDVATLYKDFVVIAANGRVWEYASQGNHTFTS